jgi:hypothetical protein
LAVHDNAKIMIKFYQIKYFRHIKDMEKLNSFILLEIGPRITLLPSKAWLNTTEDKVMFNFFS